MDSRIVWLSGLGFMFIHLLISITGVAATVMRSSKECEMAKARKQITGWVVEALTDLGGSASFLEISKYVWERHEDDIRALGDLLYEWQYELRWSAYFLRREGLLKAADDSPRGIWELNSASA